MLGSMAIAVKWYSCIFLVMMLFFTKMALAQQAGSIRGIVYERILTSPLPQHRSQLLKRATK